MLPAKNKEYNIINSFGYALTGLKTAITREPNLLIQFSTGLSVVVLCLLLRHFQLAFFNLLMMAVVMSLELLNAAFETLCDIYSKKFNQKIKEVKDIAAGGVLITSVVWFCLLVFTIFYLVRVDLRLLI